MKFGGVANKLENVNKIKNIIRKSLRFGFKVFKIVNSFLICELFYLWAVLSIFN